LVSKRLDSNLRKNLDGTRVKEEMDRASDQAEIRRLKLRLKELQYLQIWQMEKLERMSD
jgi:hypothetical protein